MGTTISPGGSVSPQAAAAGKLWASRSSARMRTRGAGVLLPPRSSLDKRSARETFHRPRVLNMGASRKGLNQEIPSRRRAQVVEDVFQGEAMLRSQRKDDRLFVGGRLQLEAEAPAEKRLRNTKPQARG